jgi:hypothetical protein
MAVEGVVTGFGQQSRRAGEQSLGNNFTKRETEREQRKKLSAKNLIDRVLGVSEKKRRGG